MSARNFFKTGRKIVAIGRNYSLVAEFLKPVKLSVLWLTQGSWREHAKELGNAVPKSPFFFLKPTSSFLANGGSIEVPQGCDVHHESMYMLRMVGVLENKVYWICIHSWARCYHWPRGSGCQGCRCYGLRWWYISQSLLTTCCNRPNSNNLMLPLIRLGVGNWYDSQRLASASKVQGPTMECR